MTRLVAALVALLVLAIPTGVLAQEDTPGAGSGVTIEAVETDGYPDVLVLVTAPPQFLTSDLGPEDWIVFEGDEQQEVLQVARIEGDQIEIVLAIDSSGSMSDGGLEQATAAASQFLDRLPEGTQVALVGFGDEAAIVVDFTPDLEAVRAGLQGLTPGGETALYDAIVASSALFSDSSDARRTLIVLTDGGDTVSTASENQAALSIRSADASFFAIELQTDETASEPLAALSTSAGGQKVGTTPEEVAGVYEEIASRVVSQYVLRYESDGAGATRLRVAVAAEGDVAPATLGTRLPVTGTVDRTFPTTTIVGPTEPATTPPTLAGTTVEAPRTAQRSFVWYGIGALFVGLAVLLVFLLQPVDGRRSGSSVRPSFRTSRQKAVSGLARGLVGAADRAAARRGSTGIDGALERAGLDLRPGEFVVLTALVGFVALIAGIFVLDSIVVGLVSFVIIVALSSFVLSALGKRRRRKFVEQLPDVLSMLASTIRTGYAPLQATELVSRESPDPTKQELSRVVAEARLGRDYIDAMGAAAVRTDSEDLQWVVEAMEINRDVGGDISELLETVAQTIRERVTLRRMISALSAEGRLSAWVLIALPFALALFLVRTNPGYLEPLYTTTFGIILIILALVSIGLGVWVISKILDLEA